MATSKVNKSIFTELPVPSKIIYSRDRVIDMTGNPNFPSPSPTLAVVTTVTNDLETTQLAAEGGGPAQTAARDAAELIWDNTMRSLADYVDSIALGNTVIITSAGFTPTDTQRTPHGTPAKPENLKLKHSEEEGAVLFSCDPVPVAESYVAVLSTDSSIPVSALGTQLIIEIETPVAAPFAPPLAPPPTPVPSDSNIIVIDASKERKKTIRGLESGKRIYAKMYCFNAAGRGPDSDMISIMVG